MVYKGKLKQEVKIYMNSLIFIAITAFALLMGNIVNDIKS
jgi:hypothetical protein